ARSLLEARTDEGEVRLSVLRTVRSFVTRVGDGAMLDAARARHTRHFAALAERATSEKHPDAATSRRLLRERAHLLAVVEAVLDGRALDKRRAELALHALVALFVAAGEAPPARCLAVLQPTMRATRDSGADPVIVARAHLVAGAAYRAAHDRA